jgi:hypothetical protein
MSEEQSDREWRFYIEDMIGFCERVQNFRHEGQVLQRRIN